jgi:hypothetical protein
MNARTFLEEKKEDELQCGGGLEEDGKEQLLCLRKVDSRLLNHTVTSLTLDMLKASRFRYEGLNRNVKNHPGLSGDCSSKDLCGVHDLCSMLRQAQS